jgi:hypothetical protein
LIGFGWEIAEATLSGAGSALELVTHWFLTPGEGAQANPDGIGRPDSAGPDRAGVNADDHFGSDERTLRFLAVALPTLIDQLGARLAVVALPWGLGGCSPTLTVIGVEAGALVGMQTRALGRLTPASSGPPFWRLSPNSVSTPAELAAVAASLRG